MLTTLLPLAAAANAALLALALGLRAYRKRAAAGLYAAAFLLGAAAAITLITLDHAGVGWDPQISALAEGALTLASGPLLLLFATRLLGVRTPTFILFAPLAVFLLAAVIAPSWIMHAFVIERLVIVQMLFTVATGALALRHRPAGRRGVQARRLALAAVAATAVMHAAQLMRMTWPQVDALTNVVPLAAACAFLAATAAVYFGGRIGALDPLIDAPRAPDAASVALAERFEAALREGLLRDAGLALARAAAACGSNAEALNRALSIVHGATFAELLQRKRVAEAKRLLADPAEARTSMEAIGLLAGFGSRSAFYKAFSDHTGMSPARFRAQNLVQTAETGHEAGA